MNRRALLKMFGFAALPPSIARRGDSLFVPVVAQASSVGSAVAGEATFNPGQFGATPGRDATAAIQHCHDLCLARGGGHIVIDQPLTCTTLVRRGNATVTLEFWSDNVTLEFTGDGSLDFPAAGGDNYRPVMIGGMARLGGQATDIRKQRCVDAAVFPLTGIVEKGASVLRHPMASQFRKGDILYIRSGQLIPTTDTEPDAELVVVESAGNGQIVIEGGFSKPYRQEFFGPRHVSSPDAFGPPAPFGIANVTDRLTRNFRLINPRIKSDSALQVVSIWSVWGFNSTGGEIVYGNLGVGSRDSRHVLWDTALSHTGRVSGSYSIAPSTGCTDWRVHWNVRSPNFTYLHLHEGIARSTFFGQLVVGGDGGHGPALSIGARGYDIEIPYVDIDTGNSDEAGIIVSDDVTGGVHFGKVSVRSNSRRGSAIRLDTGTGIRFDQPPVMLGRNRIFKRL